MSPDAATPRQASVKKAEFAHFHLQKRSLAFLLVGATCGFLGFLCSTIIGIHKFMFNPTETNYLGQTYPSGNNYRPQTVSEMVHKQDSPEGKAFFAFCLMGAICILASWYSWQLRNVYVGSTKLLCGPCGPSWANMRHFLPPLGMLLVVCIPVTPPGQRDFGQSFAIAMHSLGAVTMIGGYGVTELHCLLFTSSTKDREVFFKPREWPLRLLLVSLSLACGVAFQLCGVVAVASQDWPCADEWRLPTTAELEAIAAQPTLRHLEVRIAKAIRQGEKLLYNTASAECYSIKAGEFWFEVLAGLFMICSLWSIWYYALERHIKVPERLPDVPKQFLRAQGYSEEYIQRGCDVVDPEGGWDCSNRNIKPDATAAPCGEKGGQLHPEGVVPGVVDVKAMSSTLKTTTQLSCWPCF